MRGAVAFVDRGRLTTHKCYNLYSTVEMLTRDGPAVIDGAATPSRFLPELGPRRNIAITFDIDKLEWRAASRR